MKTCSCCDSRFGFRFEDVEEKSLMGAVWERQACRTYTRWKTSNWWWWRWIEMFERIERDRMRWIEREKNCDNDDRQCEVRSLRWKCQFDSDSKWREVSTQVSEIGVDENLSLTFAEKLVIWTAKWWRREKPYDRLIELMNGLVGLVGCVGRVRPGSCAGFDRLKTEKLLIKA